MLRSTASKVMWVGKATVFLVGLSVILALVFGVASRALGADGDFFKVGKSNLAASVSKLIKSGAGPALRLEVGSGQPPLSVNSGAKVTNLHADKLDGRDWRSEAWHEVGTTGEPQFGHGGEADCFWSNFDAGHNSAAFYKDQFGVVHLKGLVQATDGSPFPCDANDEQDLTVFTLPAGYRPVVREVHVAISKEELGRVDIDPDGTVSVGVATPNNVANAKFWLSLDGITFRPAN